MSVHAVPLCMWGLFYVVHVGSYIYHRKSLSFLAAVICLIAPTVAAALWAVTYYIGLWMIMNNG